MKIQLVFLTMMVAFLSACSKPYAGDGQGQTASDDPMYGTTTYDGASPYGQTSTGIGDYGYAGNSASTADYYSAPSYGRDVVGGPSSTDKDRIIYFAFDSYNLDARSEAVIYAHAQYLARNPQTMVVLEGHTDERGSRDYNLGLGERRSYAVREVLQRAGVSARQMRVLSYGEERPAVWGSNEDSYARNRRVVIVY